MIVNVTATQHVMKTKIGSQVFLYFGYLLLLLLLGERYFKIPLSADIAVTDIKEIILLQPVEMLFLIAWNRMTK